MRCSWQSVGAEQASFSRLKAPQVPCCALASSRQVEPLGHCCCAVQVAPMLLTVAPAQLEVARLHTRLA